MYGYFEEYHGQEELLQKQILTERKNFTKKIVNDIIRDIESDFLFCEDKKTIGDNVVHNDSMTSAGCDPVVIAVMAQNRIKEMRLIGGGFLGIKKIVNYEGGRDYATVLIKSGENVNEKFYLSTEAEDAKGGKPYLHELTEVRQNGDVFFENRLKILPTDPDQIKLTYARLYKSLDWIITADIDISEVELEARGHAVVAQQEIYEEARKTAFILLILLFLTSFIVYFSHHRVKRNISLYNKRVKEQERELNNLNLSLKKRIEKQTAAVKESTAVLKAILQAADNVAFVITRFADEGLVIIAVSSGVGKMLGYQRDELVNQNPSLLFPPEIGRHILKENMRSEKGFSGEMTLMKSNGEKLPVLYSNQPRYDAAGIHSGNITVAVDISQLHESRKALSITEELLQQAQKMEAIGTLAGGIAHDFNNVLSSIVGYSELVKEQLDPESQPYLDVEQVLLASTRAATLVKQILAFSRNRNMEKSYFEPAIIVKETLKMLRSTIPATIEIQSEISAEGETIYANSTHFHQMFMNLCTNGYQAMESEGGVLTVSLVKMSSLDHIPDNSSLTGESLIELVVADTGSGISSEIKEKVFEPFFSTRISDKGTGMGLSTASDIVKKSGGLIWFNDRTERGTEFHVVLPISEDEFDQNGRETGTGSVPHGSETILFVDDEPEITRMAKIMLESIGYNVHTSNGSAEALENFIQNEDIFDLIITDQIMPEMTGAELAQNIRQRSATVPIILSTGYSARISEENWMRHGINGFIMKPFRKREMARLIRETLDSRQR